MKTLLRSLVLSRTYRLSSAHLPANAAVDEANRLYWRANLRRLEAEAIRDSLLVAGGNTADGGNAPSRTAESATRINGMMAVGAVGRELEVLIASATRPRPGAGPARSAPRR